MIGSRISKDEDEFVHLREMPKVDLHRHLSGSIRFATLFELAREAGLNLPISSPEQLETAAAIRVPVSSLSEFISPRNALRPWNLMNKIVTSSAIASRLTAEALEDAANDGVRYVELRISPYSIENEAKLSLCEFLGGLNAGLITGSKDTGIIGRLILGLSRHNLVKLPAREREDYYSRLLSVAEQFRGNCVVGFDLAGTERAAAPHMFSDFFEEAKRLGFGVTIHAGEGEPQRNIWEAIELLKADRISHGTTLEGDDRLLEAVASREIVVEQCITSNLMTSVVDSPANHPLTRLLRAGIRVVLCTDNPVVLGISLTDEYEFAMKHLGVTERQLRQMNQWATAASFNNQTLAPGT